MKRKQIFGFDYTNNEYMKIFMYLLVGSSAALLEWSLFYIFFRLLSAGAVFSMQTQTVLAATTWLCLVDAISLCALQPLCLRQRQPLSPRDGSVPGLRCQCHRPGLESPAHVAVYVTGYFRAESDGVENHGQCHRHRLELCVA